MEENTSLFNYLIDAGFYHLRLIPNRGVCGLCRFVFTVGLCYNLQRDDFHIYDGRYCFNSESEATEALDNWNGIGDPDADWIKHKGTKEYSNPKSITN